MGLCKDSSVDYLQRLGYNVVKHPREGIGPLDLVGRQGGGVENLGSLGDMLVSPPPTAPAVETDLAAAEINGQQSSSLDLSIGVNLLGSLIGAMGGGNLGVTTGYTNARKITFVFESVLTDRVEPLRVNRYLTEGTIDAQSPLIQEYVFGNGKLFVITDVIKSNKFTVKYEAGDKVEAAVDVPVIQEAVGAKVKVSASVDRQNVVTFEGKQHLAFGFRCLTLGVLDGELRLTITKPGAVALSVGEKVAEEEYDVLESGLLTLEEPKV